MERFTKALVELEIVEINLKNIYNFFWTKLIIITHLSKLAIYKLNFMHWYILETLKLSQN